MTLNFRSKITYVAWCLRATEKLYQLQYWSLYWASSIAGFSISSSRSDTHFLTLSTLPYGRAAAAAYLHHILRESPYNNISLISLILSLSLLLFLSTKTLSHFSLWTCYNILSSDVSTFFSLFHEMKSCQYEIMPTCQYEIMPACHTKQKEPKYCGICFASMGDRGLHFCLFHTVIAIWRGIFWLKWQGN